MIDKQRECAITIMELQKAVERYVTFSELDIRQYLNCLIIYSPVEHILLGYQ